MKIYNSLSRQIEEIVPIKEGRVGMYTCGPTVYSTVTIGNWRTYVLADWLVRALQYLGLEVSYVMNITDVGHLTGDNLGDADTGEDRLEKAAKRERKTAWQVAQAYTDEFLEGFAELNLSKPMVFCKATDHIREQIELIKRIEEKGFAYRISDGVYFDVKAFEAAGSKYGELSNLTEIKEGARVEVNPEKRDKRDFALWKFSPKNEKRDMEWESPWGVGFPGWHIECSAMGMKYLGEQFDIHVGGEDLRSTHHPNEIAQSEASTGKGPFVKYWVHGAFLLVDGGRMGKSLGNAYSLNDLGEKGFGAMDLKYFYLSGHYRKQLNFTWEALKAASEARDKLVRMLLGYKQGSERTNLREDKLKKIDNYREKFLHAIGDDLNMPEALAVVWEVVKSNVADYDKYDLILDFDEVLGLGLRKSLEGLSEEQASEELTKMLEERNRLREEKKWEEADAVREKIEKQGWRVEDDGEESRLVRRR